MFLNLIPNSPYNFQIARLLRVDFDFLTDVTDVDRNGVVRTDRLLVPDALVDLFNRKYLAWIFYQQQENVVFDRGQFDWFALDADFFCFNPQSVISQSLTCQHKADCDLPHVSGGYRFLSAHHCR